MADFLVWRDCERVGIGWDWLRQQRDHRPPDLLSAFGCFDNLCLKPSTDSVPITSIPNLEEWILAVLSVVEEDPKQPSPPPAFRSNTPTLTRVSISRNR